MRRRLYLFYLYTENITYNQIELYLRRKSSCFLPKNQTDRAGWLKKTRNTCIIHIALCEIMILLRRLQNKFTYAPVLYYIQLYLCR